MHPISTTSRPIMTFIADHGLQVEQQVVDLLSGEQFKPEYCAINPNSYVPVLQDGDFRLTESSAILKYLADKVGSATYPKDLQKRARVNEVMDWFNTNFYRNFGYGLVYPQLLSYMRLADEAAHKLSLAAGKQGAERFLKVLDQHFLGGGKRYLCGDEMTIADYFATGMLSLGEVIGCSYAAYPNVARWYAAMKARPNWQAANAGVFGWAEAAKGPAYERV